MQVQRINSTSFGALIRIKDPENFVKAFNQAYNNLPDATKISSGSSSTNLVSSVATVIPAAKTTASGSYTAGSAFSLHQSGVDSFGIAPYIAGKAAVSAGPSAAQFSEECPIAAGGLFSTAGTWLNRHFRLFGNSNRKIPS